MPVDMESRNSPGFNPNILRHSGKKIWIGISSRNYVHKDTAQDFLQGAEGPGELAFCG
jgi:hypothetical protein